MRKISVVISSLRPDRLEETIDTTAMHSDWVEVVVASPTPPRPRDFVVHVPVPPPGDPNELSWSQKNNLAVKAASGEYLVFNNDDIHFRPGWAPAILKHMEAQAKVRPYLAAFHMANKGVLHTRYTAFGMLYPNHGCLRKADLAYIGQTLFDERFWLTHNDVDLGMRIWFAGGRVEMCPDVILDIDRDKPSPVTNPYRTKFFDRDSDTFMRIWFPRYFWKFVLHYRHLRKFFTHADGVLPPERPNAGAFRELLIPYAYVNFMKGIGRHQHPHAQFQRNRLVRVINRRWHQMDYQLPPCFK